MNFLTELKPSERLRGRSIFRARYSGGGGTEGSATGTDGAAAGTDGKATEGEKVTFDDVLKNREYQSEFDKRISQALETAKQKWNRETEEKLSEARKTAQMNADEKAKYDFKKREEELLMREEKASQRELLFSAKESLSEKGLPVALSKVLSFSDEESLKESIDTLEKTFREEVQKAVDLKLKESGHTPKDGKKTSQDPFLEGLGIKNN